MRTVGMPASNSLSSSPWSNSWREVMSTPSTRRLMNSVTMRWSSPGEPYLVKLSTL